MPRRFDLIISDVDGCLSPESSTPIDIETVAKLSAHNRRAFETGDLPPITLCTGRPQPFVEAMARFMQNTQIPCVCENGVWVYHPGTNVYTMDPSITESHLDAKAAVERFVRTELGPQGVTIQPGKAASVSLFHADHEYLETLQPVLRERFEREAWPFRVSMTWFYINCDLAHIDKGSGLDRMLTDLGLTDKTRLAGIGDTESDLTIRERVGWFGCPSNAREALKPAADFVATAPEIDGVLQILDQLV